MSDVKKISRIIGLIFLPRVFLTNALMIITCGSAGAQLCWKKHDPTTCKYHFLTEIGLFRAVNNDRAPISIDFSLGVTKNLNESIGLGVLGKIDLNNGLIGGGIRLSAYPSTNSEFQITPKIIVISTSGGRYRLPSFELETGFSWKNHVGIFLKLETKNRPSDISYPVYSVGLKTGGLISPVVGVIGGVALIAFIISFFG